MDCLNLKECLTNESELGPVLEHPAEKLPLKLYVFQNLIQDDKVVQQLRDDINSYVKLRKKDNDLYKFKQSKDLLTETPAKKLTPTMTKFIDAMQEDVRKELEKMTGKQLSDKHFDITASRYDQGNYLLCHNDDIKDSLKNHKRALAFVYYLNTRPWTKQDGGSLILYGSDSTGEPIEVSNTISPRPNSLVVFETTETSWHSVEEVFCKDDFRLSINGWFHTDIIPAAAVQVDDSTERHIETCPLPFVRPIPLDDKLESFFKDYFNPEYLMEKTCLLVKRRFKRDSEINLINFLNKDKFEEINEAFKKAANDESNLLHVGPYNKRNYRRIQVDKLPQVCKDLYDAFRSELFFLYLSRITGLDLQPPSIKNDYADSGGRQGGNSSSKGSADENSDDDDDDDDEEDSDEELDLEDESEGSDDEDDDDDEGGDEEKKPEQEGTSCKTKSIVDQYKDESSAVKATPAESSEPTTSKQGSQEVDKTSQTNNNGSSFGDDKQQQQQQQQQQQARKRRRTANPLARLEFRHLDAGSYTLIHDYGFEMGEKSALDVILHFNHDYEVNLEHGGYISYIDCAPDDDPHDMEHELLTVEPRSNCLSLAYRCDGETCRFLKYITRGHRSAYQDLHCVYYERPDDLPPKSVAAYLSSDSVTNLAAPATSSSATG